MNGWPLAYFEGPASPAKRLAEIGPRADGRLLVNEGAKRNFSKLPKVCHSRPRDCFPKLAMQTDVNSGGGSRQSAFRLAAEIVELWWIWVRG